MRRILVTGAGGQIGTDLVSALREAEGIEWLVESDVRPVRRRTDGDGFFESLDVRDREGLERVIVDHRIDTVFHLASLLSASGEESPEPCWDVNVNGLRNVLALAALHRLRIFWPSSIAVFGPTTPKHDTPQDTVLDPTTIYGVTKVSGELLCRYAAREERVDVRSVRFPGLISHNAPPGGGTTDYAVNIFYAALEEGEYTSFVRAETRLPMMYMPDAIRAIRELMAAEPESISVRSSYNVAALTFSVDELASEIRRRLPGFECRYAPDFRQEIADSWPSAVDDTRARVDWGWRHHHHLPDLVDDMLRNLASRLDREGRLSTSAREALALHRSTVN
jgi:nucleoside-diphosphate-sugar epimerase